LNLEDPSEQPRPEWCWGDSVPLQRRDASSVIMVLWFVIMTLDTSCSALESLFKFTGMMTRADYVSISIHFRTIYNGFTTGTLTMVEV